MKEKIKVEFEIDCSAIANEIGRRCTNADLEEKVCNLVIESCIDQIKYSDAIEWDEHKRIIKVVGEYLKEDYPLNEEYDGYDGQ